MIKLELHKDWYFFVLENDDVTWKPRIPRAIFSEILRLFLSKVQFKLLLILLNDFVFHVHLVIMLKVTHPKNLAAHEKKPSKQTLAKTVRALQLVTSSLFFQFKIW